MFTHLIPIQKTLRNIVSIQKTPTKALKILLNQNKIKLLTKPKNQML